MQWRRRPRAASGESGNPSEYRLAAQAIEDLRDIRAYIEAQRPGAADKVATAIHRRFFVLVRWPEFGRKQDELRPGVRSTPVGAYVIFYRVVEGVVEILRVLHGRQDAAEAMRTLSSD